jgi:hypothetical protein
VKSREGLLNPGCAAAQKRYFRRTSGQEASARDLMGRIPLDTNFH